MEREQGCDIFRIHYTDGRAVSAVSLFVLCSVFALGAFLDVQHGGHRICRSSEKAIRQAIGYVAGAAFNEFWGHPGVSFGHCHDGYWCTLSLDKRACEQKLLIKDWNRLYCENSVRSRPPKTVIATFAALLCDFFL